MMAANRPRGSGLESIAAAVAAQPGIRLSDLAVAAGVPPSSGLISYAIRRGLVHVSGPRGWQHYYPSAELAQANDERLRADAAQRRVDAQRRHDAEGNRRRKAARKALGGRSVNTRPASAVTGDPIGTFVVLGVKITRRAPMEDQFAATVAPRVVCADDARPWATAYTRGRHD